jgi:hypothetical protein
MRGVRQAVARLRRRSAAAPTKEKPINTSTPAVSDMLPLFAPVAGIGAAGATARTLSTNDAVRPSGDDAMMVNLPGLDGDDATSVAEPLALATAVPSDAPLREYVTTTAATKPVAVNETGAPTVVVGVGVVRSAVAGGYALAGVTWEIPNAHVANTAVKIPIARFIMSALCLIRKFSSTPTVLPDHHSQ